jgi:hypothetical protein
MAAQLQIVLSASQRSFVAYGKRKQLYAYVKVTDTSAWFVDWI